MKSFKPKQYDELIKIYRQCLVWNNSKISNKHLNKFMSLYLQCPDWFKSDSRNYHMFLFPSLSLSSKVKHKRNRILRKYLKLGMK